MTMSETAKANFLRANAIMSAMLPDGVRSEADRSADLMSVLMADDTSVLDVLISVTTYAADIVVVAADLLGVTPREFISQMAMIVELDLLNEQPPAEDEKTEDPEP